MLNEDMKIGLGKEAWKQIELIQGYSYISDAIEEEDNYAALTIMERSLDYHKQCVKILKKLIKQNTINS